MFCLWVCFFFWKGGEVGDALGRIAFPGGVSARPRGGAKASQRGHQPSWRSAEGKGGRGTWACLWSSTGSGNLERPLNEQGYIQCPQCPLQSSNLKRRFTRNACKAPFVRAEKPKVTNLTPAKLYINIQPAICRHLSSLLPLGNEPKPLQQLGRSVAGGVPPRPCAGAAASERGADVF